MSWYTKHYHQAVFGVEPTWHLNKPLSALLESAHQIHDQSKTSLLQGIRDIFLNATGIFKELMSKNA